MEGVICDNHVRKEDLKYTSEATRFPKRSRDKICENLQAEIKGMCKVLL